MGIFPSNYVSRGGGPPPCEMASFQELVAEEVIGIGGFGKVPYRGAGVRRAGSCEGCSPGP